MICAVALFTPAVLGYGSVKAAEEEPREGHFVAPDIPPAIVGAASSSTPSVPGFYQTSEYMISSVAVGVILPESNGTIDAELSDWTLDQRQRVLDEVRAGLDWWSQLAPEADLTFVIDDHATIPIPTGYEPITNPQYQEGLWIGETLSGLGYTDGSYWTRVRQYVNDLRGTYHTDWAFAVFVVNSYGDADAAFADRYFAYAYVGGPFTVMTYDNAGYGIGNMDAVTAHETGHIFRALDQYASAGVACTARSGYLGVETQNSQQAGCASNVPSIMRGGIYPYTAKAIDPYASGQIGWHDSDGDGVFDPVDTIPSLQIDSNVENDGEWRYLGHALDNPALSPLRPTATINDVWVEYSINGGAWTAADPIDGSFDSPSESFELMVRPTTSGNHRIVLRARNTIGNVSTAATYVAVIPDPTDGGLDTWLEPPAGLPGGRGAAFAQGVASSFNADGTPDAAITRVEYRIDGGDWQVAQPQDGHFDSAEEGFTVPLNMSGGTHLIEARAIDANGKIERNTAGLEINVNYAVFIPIVNK